MPAGRTAVDGGLDPPADASRSTRWTPSLDALTEGWREGREPQTARLPPLASGLSR
ncbi:MULTISPECIES: hypothetical protein [unclassified Streptomyces]|uniref:hypothetical protein n=1 Tax=unclassified Streptomyces TaxID=2593676 RepID=UPI00340090BB